MKAVVGQYGVVLNEPVSEFAVEQGQIGSQLVFPEVREALRKGAMEAFGMGVHVRGAGTGPIVREAAVLAGFLEVAPER